MGGLYSTQFAGEVFYRESQNRTLLEKARAALKSSETPEHLFIVTWKRVPYMFNGNDVSIIYHNVIPVSYIFFST